ncbi:hypothetical protein [Kurthia massiliensis]|uniref:hypothetical protein n=1 Tax=Kurthia massiliensis TaxID=1033739 RepID=UPI000288DE1A|nr:hypothetical protein [Kurthia massiliensis]
MGKHKIVKSAAAVALTASVVATAVAPQASAAAYKVNKKDQLVSSTTGKLVKGWKVFGGKLYKNGKLAPAKKYKIIGKGAAQRLYYGPTLKKGYKTANSKTLLFKDGKLADGWKQAGKNERLYKNGKLDKGYTVYTNVEGDKFLYLNGKLKKGDKTATRAGETLLFTDGLLSKGLKEFKGKTYYNGKVANGTIEGKEYDNGVLVTDIASVKAINATTVEVEFKKEQVQADTKAADFKIEGLEVTNAVVKQDNKKIVILTTSAQEAGKEYTLTHGESSKKFTGVSAVVPTAISANKITDYQTSQQAVIGQQVTVKSVVTVAEGQSKAGIPVTFNIANDQVFGEDKVVEVLTDENGVASYTYTQYKAVDGQDTIYSYPTGKPELRTSSTVYWKTSDANILKVADVTTAADVANNGKKVYKVTGGKSSGTVNVTFAENYEVTPDKVDYKAQVIDATTGKVTPFQVKNGTQQEAVISLNAKGEAEFTVSGANTSVTPVVFEDKAPTNRLNVDERQVTASKVTFSNIQTIGLTNVAAGSANAAAATETVVGAAKHAENFGGRTYTATLTDKNGKTAPAGTTVYVKFDEKEANKAPNIKDALEVFDVNGDKAPNQATANGEKIYKLTTDKNGQVTYTVSSQKANNYATPIVFVENGSVAGLDPQDTQAKGEITYFGDAKVATAKLTFSKNGKEVTKAKAGETVDVEFQTVDQNGFPYAPTTAGKVTLDFSTTFGNLNLAGLALNLDGQQIQLGNTNNSVEATLSSKGDVKFQLKSDNESDVNITATTTKAGVGLVTGSIAFEGKSTGLVTSDIVTAVNNALDTDTIKKALADVAAYQDLEDKDAFAKDVLDQLTKGNKYTVASLTKEIANAKAVEVANTAADSLSKTEPTQAEIDAAQDAVNAVEDGDAKDAAQAKIDAAKKLLAANTAVADLEGKTAPTQNDVTAAQAKVTAVEAGDAKNALQGRVDAVNNAVAGKTTKLTATETATFTGTAFADLADKLANVTIKQDGTDLTVSGEGAVSTSTAFPALTAGAAYVGFNIEAPKGFTATGYSLGNGNTSNVDGVNNAYVVLSFTAEELAQTANKTKNLTINWTGDNGATATSTFVIDYTDLVKAQQ